MQNARMSPAQLRSLYAKRSKYGATKSKVGVRVFDSKAEAARFEYWDGLWRTKAIRWVLCQVPFYLPGGVRYRLDFMVQHLDGSLVYEDVKGVITETSALKIRQVESIYGIDVTLIIKEKRRG